MMCFPSPGVTFLTRRRSEESRALACCATLPCSGGPEVLSFSLFFLAPEHGRVAQHALSL
jgi:hypothetical protein